MVVRVLLECVHWSRRSQIDNVVLWFSFGCVSLCVSYFEYSQNVLIDLCDLLTFFVLK